MNTIALTFEINGAGSCLYTELIDLHSLGQLEVSRATTIEFNNAKQVWEVKDSTGEILFQNPSRSICLAWEHQQFNR
jgi:hypothetical protein